MRIVGFIAVSAFALALAACNDSAPAAPAPDPTVSAATTETAVAEALAKRDAEAVALHADAGPAVYFVNLRDGMTVPQSFRVVFGAYGIGVAPALVDKPNTGHHHLLIDTELSAEEMQYAIPNDAQHMHFGGGQTEVVLQLGPGQHTLQLAFGDMNHELHKPAHIMSSKITVTVQ
ncbi:MAG: DUF4399 domain-containing protein [Hyphomonadaceae bacterium]|nr:DUF4399 domain-containing protein [Hyphomonadaceae bacterium]